MIKKKNENTYMEYRDKLTAGEKERYTFAKSPKIRANAKGEISYEMDTTYENSPNFYLLARVIQRVVQDGVDITPKDRTVSAFLAMMDDKLYESELLTEVINDLLEKNGFLELKKSSENDVKSSEK